VKVRSPVTLINGVALALVILVSLLANATKLNGHTTGEVSAAFPTLITPAPYAFAIWGVIYVALLGFLTYSSKADNHTTITLNRMTPWFVLSCLANIAWLWLWHHQQFALTVSAISILLIALIMIYMQLPTCTEVNSLRERLFVTAPFSLYLGWVSVATLANISVALIYTSPWDGFGIDQMLWAAVMAVIITKITLIIVITRADFIFASVIAWGFVGVLVNHDSTTWLANVLAACVVAIVTISLIKLVNVLMWDNSTSILSITEREP